MVDRGSVCAVEEATVEPGMMLNMVRDCQLASTSLPMSLGISLIKPKEIDYGVLAKRCPRPPRMLRRSVVLSIHSVGDAFALSLESLYWIVRPTASRVRRANGSAPECRRFGGIARLAQASVQRSAM